MEAVAGVDVGGTKVQGVVIDHKFKLLGQARAKTPTEGGPEAVVKVIAEVIEAAAGDAKLATGKLGGVGVGTPGRIAADTGEVYGAANLTGFQDPVPLGRLVATAVGIDHVLIDNDVSVATAAEHKLGAGKRFDDLLVVFVGSGVGSGIILGGKHWKGAHGAAGELGHTVVVNDGVVCTCGRRGCVEAYSGRIALERMARAAAAEGRRTSLLAIQERLGRTRMASGVWAEALEEGDALAHELIEGAVKALAAGIASAMNLLDVEAVLIGGGLGDKLGEPFVRRIEQAMTPHLFTNPAQLEVLPAALGDLGGALGAALLARRAS